MAASFEVNVCSVYFILEKNMNELQKIADIEAQIEAFLKRYDCDNVIDELEISPTPSKRLKKVSDHSCFWPSFGSSCY